MVYESVCYPSAYFPISYSYIILQDSYRNSTLRCKKRFFPIYTSENTFIAHYDITEYFLILCADRQALLSPSIVRETKVCFYSAPVV